MNSIFDNAKWITLGRAPGEIRDKINVWEHPLTEEVLKQDIMPGSGIPVFCKKFELKENISRCTIYITSLGCFNLYVNGKRISHDELMPGWTDYNKRVLFYEYDITDSVVSGDANAVAVPVSLGWWSGRISLDMYGDHDLAVICTIKVEYGDGNCEYIYSDTDWRGTFNGPVRYADIWDGEVYDANYDSYAAMSMVDYPCEKLDAATHLFTEFKGVISPKVGPSVSVRDFLDMKPQTATVYNGTEDNGSDFGRVCVVRTLSTPDAAGNIVLRKGEIVNYDLGQNMVGWANFTVRGKKGTTITLRHAEMLNDSGLISRGNDGPDGSVYTSNYRTAKARVKYTLCGEEQESYRPAFTFFGFRYIALSADEDIEIISFKCDTVGSDTPETGYIETSSADINKLYNNILWGQRGNYLSIPTDCPQRDETLGWTGDTQVFVCTGAYNADVKEFFRKWLQDVRDSQYDSGMYPDVIPTYRTACNGGAAWSDAGIIVPYVVYKMYGDKSIISESYFSMEKYMQWLDTTNMEGPVQTYGDWLAYEPTDTRLISIGYYAYDALLFSKMSGVLSECDDDIYAKNSTKYMELYDKLRNHFCELYLDGEGNMTQTSQTAYLLALKFGLLPEKYQDKAKEALAKKIVDNGYKLSTGFVGTATLCQTLSEIGQSNLAYSLLLQTENPSWLYSIYQGATTVWERWDSYTKEKGFGPIIMNSFNHYAYGVVAEWMYKYMLGIETDETEVGFKHIILQPKPDTRKDEEMPAGQERITWVRGHYESASGMIQAAWSVDGGVFTYNVSVPENTTATLLLPVSEEAISFTIDDKTYDVSQCAKKDNCVIIPLAAGKHEAVCNI